MSAVKLCLLFFVAQIFVLPILTQHAIDPPYLQQIISAQQQQQQQLQQQQDQIQQQQQNLQQQMEQKEKEIVAQAQAQAAAAVQFPTEVISFPLTDPEVQLIQKPIEYLPVSGRDSMFPMSRTIPRRKRPEVSLVSMEEVMKIIPDLCNIVREMVLVVFDMLSFMYQERRHRVLLIARNINILLDDIHMVILKINHNLQYFWNALTELPIIKELYYIGYYPRMVLRTLTEFPLNIVKFIRELLLTILTDNMMGVPIVQISH